MNITFKHLSLKNFCGLKELDVDLYPRTIIKGVNATGKTTISNAIYWILTDKTVDGAQADVKPRDKDGEEIHNLETEVTLTMDCDGKEVRAKKIQTENWIKNKTTHENVYKGNECSYFVNEIPKKKLDFEEYLSQFVNLNELAFCMNPRIFLNMATKDRRATLFSLVDNSDEAVIATDERFKELENDLQDGTIEELINRAKKAKSVYTDELKEIPARIDELNLHIEEMSEEEIVTTQNTLADAEKKLEESTEFAKTYEDLGRKIHEDGLKIAKIVSDTDIANQKARAESGIEEQRLTQEIAMIRGDLPRLENRIKEANNRLADMETLITNYMDDIEEIKADNFNEADLKCPLCGSKYGKVKLEELRITWQEEQDKRISDKQRQIDDCGIRVSEIEADIKTWTNEIKTKEKDIKAKEKQLSGIDKKEFVPIKAEDDPEYQELVKDIETLKGLQENVAVMSGAEKQALLGIITDCKTKLNRLQTNDAYRARIDELNKEQLSISQKIADQEKMLDLLTDYQRAKIALVTDAINQYFKVIKWRFFRQQINGGWSECCEPLIDGISMDKGLNHGHKLLANLDLCEAFQRKAGIHVPLMLDDCESVDEWRIPQTDSQLICIRRTDDKDLVVGSLA